MHINIDEKEALLIIKNVSNENELNQAFELAHNTFSHNKEHKLYSWKEHPLFSPKDLIIAKDDAQTVGLIRIVPTIFNFQNTSFSTAGISSVCVASNFRGKGISRKLMHFTFDYLKKNKYKLCYAIARKSVDHFYNKFGFIGASSYQNIVIRNNHAAPSSDIEISQEIALESFSTLYDKCFHNCFGKVTRTTKYWRYILKRLSFVDDLQITSFLNHEKKIVGYAILQKDQIHEFACEKKYTGGIISSLFNMTKLDKLTFTIPFEHTMCNNITNMDATFSSRTCLHGGHVLKMLESDHIIENNCKIDQNLNLYIGQPIAGATSFNISLPDQL